MTTSVAAIDKIFFQNDNIFPDEQRNSNTTNKIIEYFYQHKSLKKIRNWGEVPMNIV